MSLLACAQQRFAKQTQTDTAAILQPPVSTRYSLQSRLEAQLRGLCEHQVMLRWFLLPFAFLALPAQPHADPRLDRWIRSKLPTAAKAVGPEVHSVTADERYVTVESAGLSMQSFGPLEARPFDGGNGIRRFIYRIPRRPIAATKPVPVPLGVIGSFLNGVPIYNLAGVLSYRDQNLWHADAITQQNAPLAPLLQALLDRREAHSPLIGFALDGYPIYGPYGWDTQQTVRGFRSSYRLRANKTRHRLPAGEELKIGRAHV